MLNIVSIAGLLLFWVWIPAATSDIFQIWFTLNRRADTSPRVIFNTFVRVFQTIGRTLCIPLAGVIFFFQGWRLDTILQFGILLLIGGLVVEMIPQFIDYYQGWRKRTGRSTASIIVDNQPDDKKEEKGKWSISFKLELTTDGTTKEPNINEEIANELII